MLQHLTYNVIIRHQGGGGWARGGAGGGGEGGAEFNYEACLYNRVPEERYNLLKWSVGDCVEVSVSLIVKGFE